ncbi:hypothetical protein BLNAU_22450 [Blattamonas nauphoetae]|uniref:Secreted protein n=1 Tax=Blattamonas nauphoetae TaxID=2049346 RepID=A0ABQ9WT08_9EUKA|nr:hypothetical protein BLNAU_22450 [Blattamonas nauphoetae]
MRLLSFLFAILSVNLNNSLSMTWAIVDLCSRHLMNILCYKLLTCSIIGRAPPDLIDSFLKSVDISSFPSDTPFRHDRDLNLISTLSHFVFRMASSNHAFVSCFVEYREKDEITFYRYLSVHTLFHDIFGSNLWKRPRQDHRRKQSVGRRAVGPTAAHP